MNIRGSRWSMSRKRRRANPFFIILMVSLIGAGIYLNLAVIPNVPPLFMPTSTPTTPPETYLTEAQMLESQGKYYQAIQAYTLASRADPKNPANYLALARLNIYNGNYREAIINAENALLLNPNNSQAFALRGFASGLMEDYMAAQSSLNSALEIDPMNAAAHAYQAEILANLAVSSQGQPGQLDKAIEASKQAESLAPNSLEAHRARGVVLEVTSNYDEAIQEFEAAIKINPNIAFLHLALGRNYRTNGDYPSAIEEFTRANALIPSDPLPDTLISRTYVRTGDYAKALQYAEAALKDDPLDPYSYGFIGLIYYYQGQYPFAAKYFRTAVQGGTASTGAVVNGLPIDQGRAGEFYYTFGLSLAKTGSCNEAIQIASLVQNTMLLNDVALGNANEIINICKNAPTAAPALQNSTTTTPTAGGEVPAATP